MIHLRFKKLKSGKFSIYLDYQVKDGFGKSKRMYDFIKIYVSRDYSNNNRIASEDKALMELAYSIRSKRELEIYGSAPGIESSAKRVNVSFLDFILSEAKKLNRNQFVTCARHLENFSKGKDILFSDITVPFLEKFAASMKGKVSHNTVVLYMVMVSTALNRAVKQGIIDESPFNNYKKPTPQESTRTFLELHEIKALKETIIPCEPQICQAFLFSCFTGLRRSDVIGLKKEHIITEKDKDGVPQQILYIRPIKSTNTSGKLLKVPLSAQAQTILSEVVNYKQTDLVFGALPASETIGRWLKQWAKAAGLKKHVHFHMARHTFATLCLTSNIDVYTTSKLLGHSSISTTQVYAKIIDEKKLNEIRKFPFISITPSK